MSRALSTSCFLILAAIIFAAAGASAAPGYEPAYANGKTVWINTIDVRQNPATKAQAELYEVVYPSTWRALGVAPPQCNPCDHQGNGIDPTDFHDHVLDSSPSDPGHGAYSPLRHVFVVYPAYNEDEAHNVAMAVAYASHLPTKSEADVDALLAARLPGGARIAIEVDMHSYFICAVVNAHAAHSASIGAAAGPSSWGQIRTTYR